VIFYSGNLRTDATVTDCGQGCTLGPGDTDDDYAAWAAVLLNFTVAAPGSVQAITYSFGSGTSIQGNVVGPGGFAPYLSLFDSSGNFLASTFFGTTCPAGANTFNGNCFDVLLDAGVLAPGAYTLAITAFENMSFAENLGGTLAGGFTGLGSLGPREQLTYAFDLVLPDAPTPEPSTEVLWVGPIAVLLYFKIRKEGARYEK